MGKWYGKVGYAIPYKKDIDIVEDRIVEKTYRGEVIQSSYKNQNTGDINDSIVLSNRLRIHADPFTRENLAYIRYVTWNGVRWRVTNVAPSYPSLVLTIGEVYNGQVPETD